ncbi:MAG TPA: hypothetical protein VNT51_00120 [Miltoncostaeaceae bacterium]|jgi:DNA-directed RNA polymerase subunit RPC12/RpoP|nr:hypothetical protein [Miltoncostaeaceae bacterium]
MATLHPFRAAAESRRAAHRVRLTKRSVYACRHCWESVQVTSARYLPDTCMGCGAATWEDDGRCGAWSDCDAERRAGEVGAHCHACGYSVWLPVRVPMTRTG